MSSVRSPSRSRSKSQLALEHRRAGQDADAAGDDARRHPLGVGVDGLEDATGAHQP